MLFKHRVGHRQRTTGEETAAQRHLTALYAQGTDQRALGVGTVGLPRDPQIRAVQRLGTEFRITAQTHQLVAGQPVGRGFYIQWRPWIP